LGVRSSANEAANDPQSKQLITKKGGGGGLRGRGGRAN